MEWLLEVVNPGFPPRSQCGPWTALSITLYVVPAFFVCLIYMGISYWIKALDHYSDNERINKVATWFSATFLFCGLGHLFGDVIVFAIGWYPFIAAWSWATFVIGAVTIVRFSKEVTTAIKRARHDYDIVEQLRYADSDRIEKIVERIRNEVGQFKFTSTSRSTQRSR